MPDPYSNLTPTAAIDYLKQKVAIPTDRWDDVKGDSHDALFVIAGAKGSFLTDLHDTLTTGIEQGQSAKDFKESQAFQNFAAGWTDKQKDWRSRIIFEANLRQSYAAGRNAYQKDPAVVKLQPYLKWVHGGSVHPRPDHLELDGQVFRQGEQPVELPSGWGCRCKYVTLTQREFDKKGYRVSKIQRGDTVAGVKLEPDEGFDYAPEMPSEERRQALMAQSVARMPQAIGRLVSMAGRIIDGLFG
jgi:uncharacterized protein with gpF-like domain